MKRSRKEPTLLTGIAYARATLTHKNPASRKDEESSSSEDEEDVPNKKIKLADSLSPFVLNSDSISASDSEELATFNVTFAGNTPAAIGHPSVEMASIESKSSNSSIPATMRPSISLSPPEFSNKKDCLQNNAPQQSSVYQAGTGFRSDHPHSIPSKQANSPAQTKDIRDTLEVVFGNQIPDDILDDMEDFNRLMNSDNPKPTYQREDTVPPHLKEPLVTNYATTPSSYIPTTSDSLSPESMNESASLKDSPNSFHVPTQPVSDLSPRKPEECDPRHFRPSIKAPLPPVQSPFSELGTKPRTSPTQLKSPDYHATISKFDPHEQPLAAMFPISSQDEFAENGSVAIPFTQVPGYFAAAIPGPAGKLTPFKAKSISNAQRTARTTTTDVSMIIDETSQVTSVAPLEPGVPHRPSHYHLQEHGENLTSDHSLGTNIAQSMMEDQLDFRTSAWASMLLERNLPPYNSFNLDSFVGSLNTSIKKMMTKEVVNRSASGSPLPAMVDQLIVLIKGIKRIEDDMKVKFRDPTGEWDGNTVSKSVWEFHPDFQVGAVVQLCNVPIIGFKKNAHYLVITPKNIAKVWPKNLPITRKQLSLLSARVYDYKSIYSKSALSTPPSISKKQLLQSKSLTMNLQSPLAKKNAEAEIRSSQSRPTANACSPSKTLHSINVMPSSTYNLPNSNANKTVAPQASSSSVTSHGLTSLPYFPPNVAPNSIMGPPASIRVSSDMPIPTSNTVNSNTAMRTNAATVTAPPPSITGTFANFHRRSNDMD